MIVPATANTENEPATGPHIESRDGLGQDNRIVFDNEANTRTNFQRRRHGGRLNMTLITMET